MKCVRKAYRYSNAIDIFQWIVFEKELVSRVVFQANIHFGAIGSDQGKGKAGPRIVNCHLKFKKVFDESLAYVYKIIHFSFI